MNAIIETGQRSDTLPIGEQATGPVKQFVLEGPTTLPAHILPVGEHRRLANSTWWIGYACAAYEEVRHLHGIVIYNRSTSIFLIREEIAQVQMLLPALMQQGLLDLGLGLETQNTL